MDAEVSTSFTLQYRRGHTREDEHAVIVASHAAAALNAAFETGTEEIMATLSQVATMDTKVWHVFFLSVRVPLHVWYGLHTLPTLAPHCHQFQSMVAIGKAN